MSDTWIDRGTEIKMLFSAPFIYFAKDMSFTDLIMAISPGDDGNPYSGLYMFSISHTVYTVVGVDLVW